MITASCRFLRKISKSAGGGLLVSDLADRGYHPLTYRYLLLQAHYRSQTEFSWPAMDAARTGLRRLLERFAAARAGSGAAAGGPARPDDAAARHRDAFASAIRDDLNTPRALAAIAAASRDDHVTDAGLTALALEADQVLAIGLADLAPADLDLRPADAAISDSAVQDLVDERNRARAARDFARSDEIRDELARAGVTVEDQPGGTSRWHWSAP